MNQKYGALFLVCSILPWMSPLTSSASLWRYSFCGLVSVMFVGLSVIYIANRPCWMGKLSDGKIAAWAWLIWWPYLGINLFAMWVLSRVSPQPPIVEVVPNLFFGRRLTASESHLFSGDNVLDLTAEFPEPQPFRERPGYASIPVLDATAPQLQQLQSATKWLDDAVRSGPTFVHCAQGHGRTATVVLAYLISHGHVVSIADGLQLLRKYRRSVQINRGQYRRLEEFLQ